MPSAYADAGGFHSRPGFVRGFFVSDVDNQVMPNRYAEVVGDLKELTEPLILLVGMALVPMAGLEPARVLRPWGF